LVRIVGLELYLIVSLGGDTGSYSNIAAKMEEISFDRATWTNAGALLTTRGWHRSIVVENTIIHLGGASGTQ